MKFFLYLSIFLLISTQSIIISAQNAKHDKPKISLSFDDGFTEDMPNYKLEEWNSMILANLEKNHLKSILFSRGNNKLDEKGKYVLQSWNDAGHKIANHTFSHRNFSSTKVSLEDFEIDFLRNDSIIRNYSNFFPYFRFPYLKEGNTKEKVDGFRSFLKMNGYKHGSVSIDASDWYIDQRLVKRLKEDPKADISGFRDFYVEHLYNRALFYDSLAYQLTNRRVHHVILLHHNLAAALFLDDLIQYFKKKGWEIIDTDKAYQDKIYSEVPSIIPAGEGLIWALAKESGKFEHILRYPAEDSDYEKEKMDKLGL